MANIFESDDANKTGDWSSNKEMNPAANSSAMENGVLENENSITDQTWRDDKPDDAGKDKLSDPARATEKPEDDIDFTYEANQE